MLFCIITYQYINTRKYSQPSKSILNEDENNSNLTYYIRDNGETPKDITGVLNVAYDPYLGYNLYDDNQTLWTPELQGRFVCTSGDGLTFRRELNYKYERVFNIGGFFLLLLFTLLITLALTAIWPILISTNRSVHYIARKLSNQNQQNNNIEDEDDDIAFKKSCCHYFKYIWLVAGGIITTMLSGIVAHIIILLFGLPAVSKVDRFGNCYFLDTSQLDTLTLSQARTISSRRILSDNTNITYINDNIEDGPKADVKINEDGSVDFYLNCESSLFQSSTGAVWQIMPEYAPYCASVDYAYHVTNTKSHQQTKCTLGSWSPDVSYGRNAGFSDHIDFEEKKTGQSCGFLNMGSQYIKGYGSYTIDTNRKWEMCELLRQSTFLFRIDENGNRQVVDFLATLTVDPRMARPYGWYTSGDEELIIPSNFDNGLPSSLIFYKVDDWKALMRQRYFRYDQKDIISIDMQNWKVQPAQFECKVMVRVPNGQDFVEFQKPCQAVKATKADDETAGVKLSTDELQLCTVVVGFTGTDRSTIISINKKNPVTLNGADKWKCDTDGNVGTNCGNEREFNEFDPEIVASMIKGTVVHADLNLDYGKSADLTVKNPFDNLFDFSEIENIIILIVTVLAVILGIGLIIWLVMKCIQHRRAVEVKIESPMNKT
jgi:cell division protein FtsL